MTTTQLLAAYADVTHVIPTAELLTWLVPGTGTDVSRAAAMAELTERDQRVRWSL